MRKTSFNGSNTDTTSINRTITMASNIKFQNVQRLNTIVGQITQRNNKEGAARSIRTGMSDKVLDLIKNRIKSNYDKLYENYDDNKNTILKKIHQVQTNMSSQNTLNKGFQKFIKEKSNFDKAKLELEAKQKHLKKLIDVRDQLKNLTNENGEFQDVFTQKCNLIQNLECYKETLDYQTAVLNNTKNQRRQIKLFLKEKYDKILIEEQSKKERIKKIQNVNHNKKAILKRISQTLKKQQLCQIPENLAEELQRKLSEYEGKHVYENIVKHQNIMSEQNRKKQQVQDIKSRQQARKTKLIRQKEQKKEYQLTYNFFLIKQQEQEKIKKICGVSSLSEIANNTLQSDSENLDVIKKQIEKSISEIKKENEKIQEEISFILTSKQSENNDNLIEEQKQFFKSDNQLKIIEVNCHKKYQLINEWQSLIQMMTSKQVKKESVGERLKEILLGISESNRKKSLKNNEISTREVVHSHAIKKRKVMGQDESECSIINNF